MRFARLVEKANRQILLTTDMALEGDGYIIVIETHYQGDQFVSLMVGGFPTRKEAYDNMMKLEDTEIMANIMKVLEALSEDEE